MIPENGSGRTYSEGGSCHSGKLHLPFAEGAKKGAPDAIQVADRYHLVANLRDTVQHLLNRERRYLLPLQEHESTTLAEPIDQMPSMEHPVPPEEAPREPGERIILTRAEALRQMRRGKRYEHYQAVVELHHQGLGRRAISRQTGISRNTLRRYLDAGAFPEQRARPKRRSLLDSYLPYLRERWNAGCQNAAQLACELQERGYRGSPTTLRALLSAWRASSPISKRTRGSKRIAAVPRTRRLSSRHASFLFVKRPEALAPTQQHSLEQICQASGELKHVYDLSQHFISMVKQREAEQLDAWLMHVKEQGPRELRGFASGIRRDYAAVRAGLSRDGQFILAQLYAVVNNGEQAKGGNLPTSVKDAFQVLSKGSLTTECSVWKTSRT